MSNSIPNSKIYKLKKGSNIMVTKYDIFNVVHKNRSNIKPIEVLKELNKNKKEYPAISRYLKELTKAGLLEKNKRGFQAKVSKKYELLYNLIQYCVKNGINYNNFLDKNFIKFINVALQKDEINSKVLKLNPRIIKKYIEILDKYGMILIISEKPLRAKVFYNVLLNNLLSYFDYTSCIINESSKSYIKEIKKELTIYKNLRRKNELEYQKIITDFKIDFIYHSLSLEGNPITLPDTIKILKNKISPADLKTIDIDEIKNYQNALSLMIRDASSKKFLNLQQVLDYHKIAMNHYPEIAGKIRKIKVFIKGNLDFEVTSPEEITNKLGILFEKYNELIVKRRVSLEEILKFAVYFHNEFQHIHPFEDGNSRITRLITFHLLQSLDIPVFDFPFGLLDEYLDYTKASKKRDDEKLYKNLQKVILFNLKKINKRLK